MYKTVLFDLDGTLLDTLQDLAAAANHTLSVLGLPTHPVNAYRQMVGHGIPNLVHRFLPENQQGEATFSLALTIFEPYYERHMNDLTAPYPGILEMLRRLKEAGVRVGVVSNKADVFVQPIVQRYFPGLVDDALGMDDAFPAKPDPASTLELLRRLGNDAAATLYCGDSGVDMTTAKNAGLYACGVLWGFRGEAELRGAGADVLVDSVQKLEDLILD